MPPLRSHPAVLIGPISLVLLGLAGVGYLTTYTARGNGLHQLFIWLAWSVLALRLIYKVFDWLTGYFFVTSKRIILVSGIRRQKIKAIWLAQVTAVEVKRTVGAKILGYGELIFHSQCPDAALVSFDYSPYPEQIGLELDGLLDPILNDFPRLWDDLDT